MGSMENTKKIVNNKNINNDIIGEVIKNNEGVLQFYNGATVFITGATGFLGKALVEKLIRSFENIDSIYVLMRSKKENSVQQRFDDFLNNLVFDRIRSEKPELLKKIKPVQGELSEENIGLSQQDQELLSGKVNIVIHSAATIRFVEPLAEALNLNTLGTKRALEQSCKFKNLKGFVYISTAYSNSDKNIIEEKVYPPEHNSNTLLQCLSTLSKDTVNSMQPILQGKHPNTYTFTKNLAEDIVSQYSHKIPVSIVRPSIVTAAYNEPYPGWIDNVTGLTGFLLQIYRGAIRSGLGRNEVMLDIVPVDIAVNACIAAAWHHKLMTNNDMPVYNCTIGDSQQITSRNIIETTIELGRTYPTKYTMFYPNFSLTNNRYLNTFWATFLHHLPAFFFDLWSKVRGKKPIYLNLLRRYNAHAGSVIFFATNQWTFRTGNYKSLIKALALTGDDRCLPSDMNCFTFKEYMKIYFLGVRTYILKDTMDSLPAAKKRLQKLYIIQIMLKIISGCFIFRILPFLFRRK